MSARYVALSTPFVNGSPDYVFCNQRPTWGVDFVYALTVPWRAGEHRGTHSGYLLSVRFLSVGFLSVGFLPVGFLASGISAGKAGKRGEGGEREGTIAVQMKSARLRLLSTVFVGEVCQRPVDSGCNQPSHLKAVPLPPRPSIEEG